MMKLKKSVLLITAVAASFFLTAATAAAETSFDVSVSFGQTDQYDFGLSSVVSQSVTDRLTIDSSVVYLINHEYEATLKLTGHVRSWFSAGGGFLLFTDESAMLPALTASAGFHPGSRFSATVSGALGLNEKNLSQPYLFRAAVDSEIVTSESIINLTLQWQLLQPMLPSPFARIDYTGDIKIYSISPDNEKFKVCLGLNACVRTDSRESDPFSMTAGFSIGLDYGTPKQGYSVTFSMVPLNTMGDHMFNKTRPWMVSTGTRFLY